MSKKEVKKPNILEEITPEQLDAINEEADKIANDMGSDSAQDLVESIATRLTSDNPSHARAAARAAGSFVSKLAPVLFEQVIYNSLGSSDVYSWTNKFTGVTLTFGNEIQYSSTYSTTANNYDASKFIPDATTDPLIETFAVRFLKNNGSLSDTSYRYKKSLSLQPKQWLPYFKSGKLSQVISDITAQMQETYRFFVASKIQEIVKNLADGNAQVTIDNAGENGKSLRLKKIESQAEDTFGAMLDLLEAITNLTDDINTTTIASDSSNIRAINIGDLVMFIPKPLLAKFRSGVLTRLPSSAQFAYDKIFTEDRIIPIGKQLKPVINTTTTEVIGIENGEPEFISGNTKIVVIERRAIQHNFVVQEHESQYFAENMVQQLTNHMWGFFAVLPFAKGFVFECRNLLKIPNVANP